MIPPDDRPTGDGGPLGTPTTDSTEDVPDNDAAKMVVSGGGVADTSSADRDHSHRPPPHARGMGTPTIVLGLALLAAFVALIYLLA